MQAMTKPLQALLVRKIDGKLQISGPTIANDKVTDVDLVLLLCDAAELKNPARKAEVTTFMLMTSGSPLSEKSKSPFNGIRTIGYMLGSILAQEYKEEDLLLWTSVEYLGNENT